MKPFEIPNILQSLKMDVENGLISVNEAAEELYNAGWSNFIDEEKAIRLLGLNPNN